MKRFRIFAAILMAALLAVPLILMAFLSLRPLRERVLDKSLELLAERLPGRFESMDARWPEPGMIELRGVVWVVDTDTLAVVDELRLHVDVRALAGRSLVVHELHILGDRVDLPLTMSALRGTDGSRSSETRGAEGGYLRPGSLPPLPSMSLERVLVTCRSLTISESQRIEGLEIAGSLNLLQDGEPELKLDVEGYDADGAWSLEAGAVHWAPELGILDGHGTLVFEQGGSCIFDLHGLGDRRFALKVGGDPDVEPGLDIVGTLGGGDVVPRTLDLVGRYRTPGSSDLDRWKAATDSAGLMPRLSGLDGSFEGGSIWHAEGPAFDLDLTIEPNDWCRGGRLALHGQDGHVFLDSLTFESTGVLLSASGRVFDGELDGLTNVRIRGVDWFEFLPPDTPRLDACSADLVLQWSGRIAEPSLAGTVRASLEVSDIRIEELAVDLSVAEGWSEGTAAWSMAVDRLAASGDLEMSVKSDAVVVRATPVLVSLANNIGSDSVGPANRSGTLEIIPADSRVNLEGISVTGVLGEAKLDGTWSPLGFDGRLDAGWSRPPAALALVLGDSLFSLLSADWTEQETWTVAVNIKGGGDRIDAVADVLLPGPRHLRILLPKGLPVDDLGAIEGVLHLGGSGGHMTLDADFSPTTWIDVGRIEAQAVGDSLILDRLTLVALGADVGASASFANDQINAEALMSISGPSPLMGIVGFERVFKTSAHLTAVVDNASNTRDVLCDLKAAYQDEKITVKEISGTFASTENTLHAKVTLPSGITASSGSLDVVEVGYAGDLPGRGVGRMWIQAGNQDVSLQASLIAALSDIAVFDCDTLNLEVAGRMLGLGSPFRLESDSRTGVLMIQGLSLVGDMGKVEIDARYADGVPTGAMDLQLHFPDEFYPSSLPVELRPESIAVEARVEPGLRQLNAEVFGLHPGARQDLRVTMAVTGNDDVLDGVIRVVDAGDTLATVTASSAPGDWKGLRDGKGAPLTVDLILAGLPLPSLPGVGWDEREVVLDGAARLRGSTRSPIGSLSLSAVARGWPELATHRLEVEAELTDADSTSGGLAAEFQLVRADVRLARGTLIVPGTASLTPLTFAAEANGVIRARLKAQDLQLDEFAPLLPAAMSVQGRLDIDMEASGQGGNVLLVGNLELKDGRVAMPDGSWFALNGRSDVKGHPYRPEITGALVFDGGVLRLPDPPRNLLPVNAKPQLWQSSSSNDNQRGSDPRAALEELADARFSPKAEVRISIPSGLRLQGQGLEAELAGNLEIRTKDGRHDIGGELVAERGFYRFLGRIFQVERGTVSFDEGEALDPALDIALTTLLEGTSYRIGFAGTLNHPTLQLTSEPEMAEGDIMAMLLFGRPLEELSSDQEGLVQDRATDLVTAYGTAVLEARLSRQLNVDMVNLKRGNGPEGSDALVIGKHLHQKVLLKYEQELDGWSSFMVNLEYYLSRHLKLETMISRHDQSAAAVNWSVEY